MPVNSQLQMFCFQWQRTETMRVNLNPERPHTQLPRGDLVILRSHPLAHGDPAFLPLPQSFDDKTPTRRVKKTGRGLPRAPELCFTLPVQGFPVNQYSGFMSPADKMLFLTVKHFREGLSLADGRRVAIKQGMK